MTVPDPDLAALLPSWELALRAERKSPQTVKTYGDGVRAYLRWCDANDRPAVLSRRQLAGFVDALLSDGAQPATARSRQLGVRRFAAWLAEEGEIDTDPLIGVKAPKLDTTVVEPLTEDQLRRLLKACAGRDLRERRDEAILRFMPETGTRAGEVVALELADLDLIAGTAVVRRGKGGKGRSVPSPRPAGYRSSARRRADCGMIVRPRTPDRRDGCPRRRVRARGVFWGSAWAGVHPV